MSPTILFVLFASLLIVFVLIVLLKPLLYAQNAQPQSAVDEQAQASLAVLREEQALLIAEHEDGALDQNAFERALAELQMRAIEDTQHAACSSAASVVTERPVLWSLAVALPLLVFMLYAWLGQPAALDPARQTSPTVDASGMFSAEQRAALAPKIDDLVKRLNDEPQDATGWLMLGRAYFLLGDADRVRAAWTLLGDRIPQDVEVLATWAQLLAAISGGDFRGPPDALIARALALSPTHLDTLMLGSVSAFSQGELTRFNAYWKKILTQIPEEHWDSVLAQISADDPSRAQIEAVMNEQRSQKH